MIVFLGMGINLKEILHCIWESCKHKMVSLVKKKGGGKMLKSAIAVSISSAKQGPHCTRWGVQMGIPH